ncbi:FAD-binding oxidoreductase [Pollutimonas bauzanensis]|uniref:FAD/FMN-containing dehydrogenase n=1 Tax=Pollutimonas bauzanensis TaxID=658167 RepID=A0A1M5YPS2_9BURK|nr:FAD-binding oxidoreductase [Pollutimonas bauzanensis]SHI13879.1 FAD/FMN-containing dehydrogenase [Pollutimonas bauzanensis]
MSLVDALIGCAGAANVLTGADAQPYLTDWRRHATGRALAVVRPRDAAQAAQIVRLCAQARAPIVPQGGNTGQVAGATPDGTGLAVVINMQRLNRIRGIDTQNDTITVEAGCVLEAVQQAAMQAGRLFPLSLGAQGSCFIGGNLATNAGGTQVLRYGNARELTLGLEVVTPQGEIWHGLRGLRKDNTGYDLRDLYIGSEGTLGLITAATLKLFPLPRARRTALLALAGLDAATALLNRARGGFGAALTGFEVMSADCLDLVTGVFPEQRLPFGPMHPRPAWYALLELSDSESEAHAQDRFESVLAPALEASEALDVAVASSEAQSAAFWHLRETITLALAAAGPCIKHDISLPVSQLADFVHETDAILRQSYPGLRLMVFGHLGDGNLHYNMLGPGGAGKEQFAAMESAIQALVHDRVHASGGSISAEQGIGQRRVDDLRRYKSPLELELMGRIKQALDPLGIMNPGKVLA